jgi:hypothetical protein
MRKEAEVKSSLPHWGFVMFIFFFGWGATSEMADNWARDFGEYGPGLAGGL